MTHAGGPGGAHTYRLSEFSDADLEAERLGRQAAITSVAERAALEEAGLARAQRLLELGCGTCQATAQLASWAPTARLVCVDVDADVLQRGEPVRRALGTRVSALKARVESLPFPPGAADAAYLRFVLQHVTRPTEVVAEVARVLAPGGLVCALDGDFGTLVVHPEPDGVAELLAASIADHAARGGDRRIGRKLVAILVEAGLAAVTVRPVVATTGELDAPLFRQLFLDPLLDQLGDPERVGRLGPALDAWAADGRAFGLMVGMLAWGRKPR